MAVTATIATVASVAVSAYSTYEQIDQARKAQNQAEENQAKLEAAAKAEDEKAQREAQLAKDKEVYAKRRSLASLVARRGRASTILTDRTGIGHQALGSS